MLCWGTVPGVSANSRKTVTLPNTYLVYYTAPALSLYYEGGLTSGAAYYGFAFRVINNASFETAALAYPRFYLTIGY